MYFAIKVLVSALIVAAASELARRSTAVGALLASLPLTSLLAIVWLYRDSGDVLRVAALSSDIVWLVLPSLVLFIMLPLLLKRGMTFYPALGISTACTVIAYLAMALLLRRLSLAR